MLPTKHFGELFSLQIFWLAYVLILHALLAKSFRTILNLSVEAYNFLQCCGAGEAENILRS